MAQTEIGYISNLQEELGGFNFDNWARNLSVLGTKKCSASTSIRPQDSALEKAIVHQAASMTARKTGTTICGLVTSEGIVLGADTRATEGPIIAIKNCEKLHRLTDNIFFAGAGVSADLHHVGAMMQSKLELLRLRTHRHPRVMTAVTMFQQFLFRYQGHITCAVILGGIDCTGPQLYNIFPHGSCDRLPFCAMGSGSLNALSVLELSYKDGLTLEEGKQIAIQAINAGVLNDLGSGGNVDVVLLPYTQRMTPTTSVAVQILRGVLPMEERPYERVYPAVFNKGMTAVLRERAEEMKPLIQALKRPSEDVDML